MEDSVFEQLPTELLLDVMNRLEFKDLLQASMVCKDFAEIANELVVKKGTIRIKYPFPERDAMTHLMRQYKCLSLVDQHFIHEPIKLQLVLDALMQAKIDLKEVRLHLLEELDDADRIFDFFAFLERNPGLRTVSLSSFYELTFNELIGKIKNIIPGVEVNILKAYEDDKNFDLVVPEKLQSLKYYTEMTEVALLNTLKRYPNLKSLRYSLKSDTDPQRVLREMAKTNIWEVSLEKLALSDTECLAESTPSLTVFKNLKRLTLHFKEDIEIRSDVVVSECNNRFKFVQNLYANNFRTLRSLRLEISSSQHIYNLLPSNHVNLVIEDMTFDLGFSDNTDEDTLKFVKLFINQQIPNLRSLYIECLEIDDELINMLSEAEHLEKLSLITCRIKFETVWPPFMSLKHLDLTDSSICLCSLQGFLGNHRIQKTLESLSIERIHPRRYRKKQLKLTSPYYFEKLKKLNLLFCNMKYDFLTKFRAPELELLNYDFHELALPLAPLNQYPKLKNLCLGNHRDFDGVVEVMSKREGIEVIEFGITSSLLETAVKYLLLNTGNIKLAKIVCKGLDDVMDALRASLLETVHNFRCDFFMDREKCIKLSNGDTTIIVHSYDHAYREHSGFYENFMCQLWD